VTRKVDQVDDYHGTRIEDPYRWLEDVDAPETAAWVAEQNGRTAAWLAAVPAREGIRARVRALWDFERFGVPRREGGRLFYSRNDGLQDQPVLLVEDGPGAAPRVLLDPNGLSAEGTVALVDWEPCPDGSLLAYALSSAGSDWMEWRVRDVATGVDRPDLLRWSKFSGASWARDGSGFWYSAYAEPAPGSEYEGVNENQQLRFHRLGDPQSADALVYARPDHPRWGFGATATEDGRWLVIHVWEGSQPENRLYLRDLRDPAGAVRPLLDAGDASYEFVDNDGDLLWILTRKDAPRGRLVAVDARDPSPARWRTVIPEGEDTLESASVCGGRFVTISMRHARSEMRVHALDGALERTVALPGTGTASGISGTRASSEVFLVYTDFFTPPAILRLDPGSGIAETFRAPQADFDRTRFVAEQVFLESADGTRVPMFLARRADLSPDGDRPVLLHAYGGFNVSLQPWFSVAHLVWMERGGILAVPNLRGGGEYGEEWHRAAILAARPRAFEDLEAAARWLASSGWSRPARIAISGGSNGGLLVGACMTRNPGMYGAALPSVGVMDMLRYHRFTIGWAWSAEYGTSDDPAQFRTLLSYSPLHNLRKGASYPPTLVTTSDHDDRVVPAHSYKFAAALQEAQGGGAPILLRVDIRSGHGMGAPTRMLVERTADTLTFLEGVVGR
jgi:prolyl oligopeptidase